MRHGELRWTIIGMTDGTKRESMNDRDTVRRDEDGKILIDSWDEAPDTLTEDEEDAWWQTHDFSDRFADELIRRDLERQAKGEPSGFPSERLARQHQQARQRD